MKPGAVALIVGLVFVVGVGVGVALNSQSQTPATRTAQGPALAQPAASKAPLVAPPEPAGPGAATGTAPAGPEATGKEPGGTAPDPGAANPHRGPGALPPAPPPPLSPEAAKEADRIKRERDARGGRGGGRVTTLVEPKDPEVRERRNSERMQSWERRLRYANDIRIKDLRASVGLDAAQEKLLRQILDDELAARMTLVDEHRLKKISDTTFDEQVKTNTAEAKQKLQALLSPEQYTKYGQLKPREQVLRDDVK